MKRDNIIVYNADCMDIMKDYPDNYFDLAIVDPPYGIDAAKMTMGKGSRNDTGENKRKDWDLYKPTESYFNELLRVSENQVIWGGNYFLDYLYSTRCFLMWDKLDYNSDFASHELAWTSFNKNVKCFQRARSAGGDQKFKIHPTQKPVKLYSWIYQNYSSPDHKIIDTHLGSGSNAIAAHYFGINEFIGVELDKDYYEAFCKRYIEETKQMDMFQ